MRLLRILLRVGEDILWIRTDMFWRERERESKEHNGGPPVGQVRVLVVGDSGNLILF